MRRAELAGEADEWSFDSHSCSLMGESCVRSAGHLGLRLRCLGGPIVGQSAPERSAARALPAEPALERTQSELGRGRRRRPHAMSGRANERLGAPVRAQLCARFSAPLLRLAKRLNLDPIRSIVRSLALGFARRIDPASEQPSLFLQPTPRANTHLRFRAPKWTLLFE